MSWQLIYRCNQCQAPVLAPLIWHGTGIPTETWTCEHGPKMQTITLTTGQIIPLYDYAQAIFKAELKKGEKQKRKKKGKPK